MRAALASTRIAAADAPSFAEVAEHESGVYVVLGHTRVRAMHLLERAMGDEHAGVRMLRSNGSVWRESDGRWLGGAVAALTARAGGLSGIHGGLIVVAVEDEHVLDDPLVADAVLGATTHEAARWFVVEEAA